MRKQEREKASFVLLYGKVFQLTDPITCQDGALDTREALRLP